MDKNFDCSPPDLHVPNIHPDLSSLELKSKDDDIFYPGQFDSAIAEDIAALNAELSNLKQQYENDSKIQTKRFIIQTVVSVIALCASVVAAVAAVIPLLQCG